MAPSDPPVQREKTYTRQIVVDGYQRVDGLWDIEGQLIDIRHRDINLPGGLLVAGTPLHEMLVRITVDDTLKILRAEAETRNAPYRICGNIAPDYARLEGLRIEGGFRREVGKLFGGLRGCSHISELLGSMGAAAFQTVRPELIKSPDERPSEIDGCHALDARGSVVALYYPKWHRHPE
jgi:hypothetical protein